VGRVEKKGEGSAVLFPSPLNEGKKVNDGYLLLRVPIMEGKREAILPQRQERRGKKKKKPLSSSFSTFKRKEKENRMEELSLIDTEKKGERSFSPRILLSRG